MKDPRRVILPLLVVVVAAALWARDPQTPVGGITASWSADSLQVGQQAHIAVTVSPGATAIEDGAELRIGFPHWVYGSRDVRAPEGATGGQFGHWYVTERLPRLAPGASHTLTLPPMRLPQTAGPFAPLVFIDWEPVAVASTPLEPGPPAEMVVVAPSVAAPGAPILVRARLDDAYGNTLVTEKSTLAAPAIPGVSRVPFVLRGAPEWTGESQPMWVAPADPPPATIAWLDLHGHSALSDGRGTPDSWYEAARSSSFLDGAALSDHDWQLTDPEWATMLAATDAWNRPEQGFVTLPAVEMNLVGHEIAYFADAQRIAAVPGKGSSQGARTIWEETDLGQPTALVPDLLGGYGTRGPDLLVATHTSLAAHMGTGFPLATPLPAHRLFEIYSAHGNSECAACARRVEGGDLEPDEQVGSLWDALDAGMDFTLIAAGDGHDGRPGRPNWGAWPGGLTAVEVPELTREAVFEALSTGQAWATTGERVLLLATWRDDGADVLVVGDGVEAVEVIGDRQVLARRDAPPQGEWLRIEGLPPSAWRYLRVSLPDGGRAWRGVWRPAPR